MGVDAATRRENRPVGVSQVQFHPHLRSGRWPAPTPGIRGLSPRCPQAGRDSLLGVVGTIPMLSTDLAACVLGRRDFDA